MNLDLKPCGCGGKPRASGHRLLFIACPDCGRTLSGSMRFRDRLIAVWNDTNQEPSTMPTKPAPSPVPKPKPGPKPKPTPDLP